MTKTTARRRFLAWRILHGVPHITAGSRAIPACLAAPVASDSLVGCHTARAELKRCGVEVSEAFQFGEGLHFLGAEGPLPGPDPTRPGGAMH